MAVKRRVIWLNDTEWDLLEKLAQAKDLTISARIRDFIIEAIAKSPAVRADAQKARDGILSRINRAG